MLVDIKPTDGWIEATIREYDLRYRIRRLDEYPEYNLLEIQLKGKKGWGRFILEFYDADDRDYINLGKFL